MRITVPAENARISIDDINLTDSDLYTQRDAHLVWKMLRAERPLFWQDRARGEGFWAVTRRADVCRVLGEHETFTSEGGTAISMLDAPDPAAGIMDAFQRSAKAPAVPRAAGQTVLATRSTRI